MFFLGYVFVDWKGPDRIMGGLHGDYEVMQTWCLVLGSLADQSSVRKWLSSGLSTAGIVLTSATIFW
jgi:hypothetical protein